VVRSAIRDAVSQYGVEEIVSTKRAELGDPPSAMKSKQGLTANNLIMDDFLLRNIRFQRMNMLQRWNRSRIAEQQALQAQVRGRAEEAGSRAGPARPAQGAGRLGGDRRQWRSANPIQIKAKAQGGRPGPRWAKFSKNNPEMLTLRIHPEDRSQSAGHLPAERHAAFLLALHQSNHTTGRSDRHRSPQPPRSYHPLQPHRFMEVVCLMFIQPDRQIRLTSYSNCAGLSIQAECGNAWRRCCARLEISSSLKNYPDLLVGLSEPDDAAIWRLDAKRALVVTTDFLYAGGGRSVRLRQYCRSQQHFGYICRWAASLSWHLT